MKKSVVLFVIVALMLIGAGTSFGQVVGVNQATTTTQETTVKNGSSENNNINAPTQNATAGLVDARTETRTENSNWTLQQRFEASKYNQSIIGIPPLYLPYGVPSSQLPEGGSVARSPMTNLNHGWCSMDDVPLFIKYSPRIFDEGWGSRPFVLDPSGRVVPNIRSTAWKSGKLLSLKNTEGRYRRTGPFRYAVHLYTDYLSRPDGRERKVWRDILPRKGRALDMEIFLQSYLCIGEVVVIGDNGVLLNEVYDMLEGFALTANVDVVFFVDNVWLKNATLAVQQGASVSGANVDIGIGGLLAAVIGEAKLKGNQWAAAYCCTEIPEGVKMCGAPPKLEAAWKENGVVPAANGNGKPTQQEGPSPEVFTQRR